MALLPCAACRRHVLEGEGVCPFCGTGRSPTASPARVVARASRGALFTMGMSLAAAGCSGTESTPQDSGPDYGEVSVDAAYGAPVDTAVDTAVDGAGDTGTADGTADAADAGDTGFAGAYGGPPPDAGGGG